MAKQLLETVTNIVKKVLRIPETRGKIGEGSLPKAKDYRSVSPASQPPPDISVNLPLKTEPVARQYLYERALKDSFDPTPGVFVENQKALDITKKREYGEEMWKGVNAMYGFDARNLRNWVRYREKTVDERGLQKVYDEHQKGQQWFNPIILNQKDQPSEKDQPSQQNQPSQHQ